MASKIQYIYEFDVSLFDLITMTLKKQRLLRNVEILAHT